MGHPVCTYAYMYIYSRATVLTLCGALQEELIELLQYPGREGVEARQHQLGVGVPAGGADRGRDGPTDGGAQALAQCLSESVQTKSR